MLPVSAVRYPGSRDLPPLPDSVIDSSGLHDMISSNCVPVTNTQQEQPSTDYHWPGSSLEKQTPVTLLSDQWVKSVLGPHQLWTAKVSVSRASLHQFNITMIEGGQPLAIFGRHLNYPSVTKHDWVHYILNDDQSYRASEARSVSQSLSEGTWYVGVYNDGDRDVEFGLVFSYQSSGAECLNNCAGHGECLMGECQCHPQWSGDDCTTSMCPVLCSGHGEYGGGQCHCHQGWKGEECHVHEDECEDPDCGGHGDCVAGVCQCEAGWTGQDCDQSEYEQLDNNNYNFSN